MFGFNEVPDLSSGGAALKKIITREPISIFSQLKNAKDQNVKEELNRLLEALKKKIPEGFKIGAAVGEGDCFFDSVAQGLNELKEKGLITSSTGFNVKFLRESCKQYAQAEQSKKGSWLADALKEEGEKVCEYISRIEFTAEDFENAVWGRSEIEGKMICEKYSVKIRVIELRDKVIDITKVKVGTGNNIVYLVNYRKHFAPLLTSIKKDIKRRLKVSREEAYDDVTSSKAGNIPAPLQGIDNSLHKQCSHSRSSTKENSETGANSRKRGCSDIGKDNKALKKLRMDVSIINDKGLKLSSDLQDKSRLDESNDAYQTDRCVPNKLIELMYQLDLSVLCSLRKCKHEYKYPLLSLVFNDPGIDKFHNIVIRNKKKLIHIQIELVDKYYIDNDIDYARLFTKEKEKWSFFINSYFDSFVKYLIPKSDSLLNNIDYLIVFTNSGLALTEENKLKQGRSRSFYPIEFDGMNMEECDVLKDFLFTNDNEEGRIFYQFSQQEAIREELVKRINFSPVAQTVLEKRNFSQKKVKDFFLDKLVFAVNQPNREELNSIVKSEIKGNKIFGEDYIALRERLLCDLTAPEKLGPGVVYEFSLLLSFLNDMFLHKNIFFINLQGKSDTPNNITINYRDKLTHVKVHHADGNIGYSQLFPSRTNERKNRFAINKHFRFFVEGLGKDIEYFIIYTNADLNLTEEKRLKKGQSKDFLPLTFDSVGIEKEKYKILRYCSCVNKNGLYQFSQKEITKISSLLKLPLSVHGEKEEGRLSSEHGKEMKEKFLNKLIFAVNQPNREELSSILKNELERNKQSHKTPYNYEELLEIALRWSESHEFGPITKRIMNKLLEDIKNNRSSYQKIQSKNIDEEIQFAKSVVGREGTPTFNQFLDFLIKGEGLKYLEVLKQQGINLTSMSSILNKAGNNAVKAFKDLYNLWFDVEGSKTQYLRTLEDEGVNLPSMSSILNGAGNNAAIAFKDLYGLWFDAKGNKTQYLKTLENEGVNLPNMTSILSGAGNNAAKAFQNLYNLWFDKKGNKAQYLKTLEDEGVNLPNMSSILNGAGANAVKAFKDLYSLWFDAEGNKTQYLKTLKDEGVNLPNMSSILSGAGANAAKAFKDLYDLWFDIKGNKTQYLKTLEDTGVNLPNMSSILSRAAGNAAKAFKDLYDVWFDTEGKKRQYLKVLEDEGMNPTNISSILHGAGANATKSFKNLYDIWFDEQGNKTDYLKHFINKKDRKRNFTLRNLSSILNGAGPNAGDAFKKLHNVCFNDEGERTKLLDDFYEAGFKPRHLSCTLCGAGARAYSTLQRLHSVCFNDEGKRTKLLDDFYEAGFRPSDLCNTLSAAADSLQMFHEFCFIGETKRYINNFLHEKGGFAPNDLSEILHGARANVCSVLKCFHDVCFDEAGNKTQLLNDLHKIGFKTKDLSNILSMAGNNAASILKDFYKLCFNSETYLDHFLAEKELFTPKNLSRILHRAGMNIRIVFEKLHDLCFDKMGKKTSYLNDLIKTNQSNVSDILREEIKKSSCFSSNKQNSSESKDKVTSHTRAASSKQESDKIKFRK